MCIRDRNEGGAVVGLTLRLAAGGGIELTAGGLQLQSGVGVPAHTHLAVDIADLSLIHISEPTRPY